MNIVHPAIINFSGVDWRGLHLLAGREKPSNTSGVVLCVFPARAHSTPLQHFVPSCLKQKIPSITLLPDVRCKSAGERRRSHADHRAVTHFQRWQTLQISSPIEMLDCFREVFQLCLSLLMIRLPSLQGEGVARSYRHFQEGLQWPFCRSFRSFANLTFRFGNRPTSSPMNNTKKKKGKVG